MLRYFLGEDTFEQGLQVLVYVANGDYYVAGEAITFNPRKIMYKLHVLI